MDLTAKLLLCSLLTLSSVEIGSEAEMTDSLEDVQDEEVAWKYIPLSGPTIDKSYSRNVTVQISKTALLNCRIKYLGGKTVSWIRGRDLHLLTVGRFTYTSDERFRVIHQTGSDDWLLKIHYAQHRDTGAYECQVSTTPPIGTTVWLNVVDEPVTQVLGGPDMYINAGSTINLTCVVSHNDDPPHYIFWYHHNELLSYDSPRGGITVVTEHGPTSSSRLLIQRATADDAGLYSCRPANAESHQINVHIIPAEHPAAIQHKNRTSSGSSIHKGSTDMISLIFSIILTFWTLFPSFILLNGKGNCFKCPKKPLQSIISENRDKLGAKDSYRIIPLTSLIKAKPHFKQKCTPLCHYPIGIFNPRRKNKFFSENEVLLRLKRCFSHSRLKKRSLYSLTVNNDFRSSKMNCLLELCNCSDIFASSYSTGSKPFHHNNVLSLFKNR